MENKKKMQLNEQETAAMQTNDLIKPSKEFVSPESLYAELIESVRKYHPSTDISLIEKAYKVADTAHKGQVRKSGEAYIIHPLCVAIILAELELDKETIVAGILHDVVEDTVMTDEEIAKEFSDEVALLVDGVTKLGQLSYKADKVEVQAENLRKMFLAMAKDIRVILIKLADRLHNMRTLKYMRPEKQKEIARETMDIYAPLAQRLGISKVKIELDDLSLKYLETDAYYDLVEKVAIRKTVRDQYIFQLVEEVKEHLKSAGIEAAVDGRAKHFFSIYKKMVNQNKTLEQIYDLFAIRVLVNSVENCYAVLGEIHKMYKPIPGRFKDYIAMPKPNMYQSLHTTLIGPTGQPFEIQIRTFEMHRTAEFGIAAHWKYKEASYGNKVVAKDQEEEKLSWLRQILEWQKDMSDNREFMRLLKSDLDLFSDTVFCFTPSGEVKNLPTGSTPIDFAYCIHTAVGNRMIGAKVNGKIVNIDYVLQNGDRVEIVTSQNSHGPSRDWLNIVKSTQAKNKISQWFRSEFKEENISRGKELLIQYCKGKRIDWAELNQLSYQTRIMHKYGFRDWESVLAAIGHGGLKEGQIVNKMQEYCKKEHKLALTDEEILKSIANGEAKTGILQENKGKGKKVRSNNGVFIKGIDNIAVRFSRCCAPVPGDEIVGFVTRGRGISIHRTDCINIINLSEIERVRLLEAEWLEQEGENGRYMAEIKIYANDRTGLIADITKIFNECQLYIDSIKSNPSKQGIATIVLSFITKSKEELNHMVDKIRQVENVIDIERTRG